MHDDSLDALRYCRFFMGGRHCGKTLLAKELARQLLNSNYGLASADNWAQRYLYTTDKLYDTLGIKEYLNKVYGDPMLKFKNGNYIDYDIFKVPNIVDLVNQIKREEEANMTENRTKLGDWVFLGDTFLTGHTAVYGAEIPTTVYAGKSGLRFAFHPEENSSFIVDVKSVDCDFNRCELRDYFFITVHATHNKLTILDNYPNNIALKKIRAAYNVHLLNMTRTAKKPVRNGLRGKFIKHNGGSGYYCITDHYLDPEYQGDKKRTRAYLHAYRKPADLTIEFWGRVVKRHSKEHIKEVYGIHEITLVYYEYDDGRIEIPYYELVEYNDYPHKAELITDRVDMDNMDISREMEMLKNYKKEEETKEMDNNILNGAFNSKLYVMKNGSEDLSYLGTVIGMSIDRALGCELTGKIDFIAGDEPVKKLQYFNREFIKNVVFNDPATIIEWKDGTKTVVQVRDGEKFDPEKGLAMAIAKKAMGNKRDYYHVFKHYLKKVDKTSKKGLKETIKSMPDELYYDNKAIDLKDFKEDSENDLVTFKCSKADAERIKGLITRDTIEEVKRYEESEKISDVDAEGPLMPL